MFRSRYVVTACILLMILLAHTSCKKEKASPAPTGFDLQYRIVHANNMITNVSYIGAEGDTLTGDVSEQSDSLWSKTIGVPKPPFTAYIKAVVNNTGTSSVDFLLEISIEGVVFNRTEKSIPPGASTDASVTFTVDR